MKPYRREKLESLIFRVVSETVAFELNDPRISPLTTVTRVKLTGDLLQATAFISVMGTDAEERRTLSGIQHAQGRVQRKVADALQIRQCPRLRFAVDEAAKLARQTFAILDENRRQNPGLAEPPPDGEVEPGESPDGAEQGDSGSFEAGHS